MRRHLTFDCSGDRLAATLDEAPNDIGGSTGIIIISGGNEVRAGAHRGQAMLAAQLAEQGIPVFRYDRRGIGDSEGVNGGFEGSADDIAAALACFREQAKIERVVAFGNCDAATALAMHHQSAAPDALVLSNPWVIEEGGIGHSPKQIRDRYWAKLRSPRALWAYVTGGMNLKKLGAGLKAAASTQVAPSGLAERIAQGLAGYDGDITILLATGDRTAQQFAERLKEPALTHVVSSPRCDIRTYDSTSHSYAREADQNWLVEQLIGAVRKVERAA